MYCWNCGHNNADDNKFCGECGKTLLVPEVPPTRRSTGIGSINIPRPDTESSKEPQKRDVSTVKVSTSHNEPVATTNDDSSYLLDDEENSSSWRGYLALAFLLIFGVLVVRQWTEMRGIAADFAQRLGIADVPKKVKAQPTVSSSENQPGQSSSQGTNTS